MEGGVNTAGMRVVTNKRYCIAGFSDGLEILAEVLGVDVAATTVAGHDVVGSLDRQRRRCAASSRHSPDEALLIEEVLGVKPMVEPFPSARPTSVPTSCFQPRRHRRNADGRSSAHQDALGFL